MSFLWTKEKVYCIINSYQQQYSFSIGKTAGGFFCYFFYLIIKQPLILLKSKVVLAC